jgi:hypothetical protein
MIAILTRVRWNLNALLIAFSMAKDVEHFSGIYLAICTSFEKCLFGSYMPIY